VLLSVVVPCYNEEAVLVETHRQLRETLDALGLEGYELIFVDDGSRDGTAALLRQLHAGCPHTRVLRLSRNFGHQTAVSAGIEHARGDAVVLIDADLQDPPSVIGDMLARWHEGYDVAYGLRTDRAGETAFKVATARWFYRMLNRLSETEIPLDVGDFRLMDRKVVDALVAMPERARFVRGMVSWVGFRQVAVPYARAERFAGNTKYPLFKMVRLAIDGVTSFSLVPLRLASWAGFLASLTALGGIVFALVVRLFTNEWVPGWAAMFVAVMFLGGIQLLALGIVGEYVGRIYFEAKRRPLYLLSERMGFGPDGARHPDIRPGEARAEPRGALGREQPTAEAAPPGAPPSAPPSGDGRSFERPAPRAPAARPPRGAASR
jgi:dolichol-phosphate mannosyltransferase